MDPEAKRRRYARLCAQLDDLLHATPDPIARMATIAALVHAKMPGLSWTGFYRLIGGDLVVGPYQGLVACQVLRRHTGVCWAAVDRGETVVVVDVHAFPGHIACDGRSRSEIVVPVRDAAGAVVAVLDVDSTRPAHFDETDREGLEPLARLVFRP
ncbi:MAG: GAF domain-containing protein [Deltaproteobacteria bacterium]|nr:GAF domain-containing protein [Deltaproteobacteria bacterium]